MRGGRIALVALALLAGALCLVAYAWIGGGREPLHEIVQPIPVPESAK